MKICVAQTRPVKGDISSNIVQHKKLINLAVSHNADMVIFPELSLTGYEPELAAALATNPDDDRFDDFQHMSDTHRIAIGVGMPTKANKGICISMILFLPHEARKMYSKHYLHSDEKPFFVSGQNFASLKIKNTNIALAICYELSIPEHSGNAFKNGAEVYIASAAKSKSGFEKAAKSLSEIAKKYSMTALMSNAVGPCDNFISVGQTGVWNKNGHLTGKLDDTCDGILVVDTDTQELIEETL